MSINGNGHNDGPSAVFEQMEPEAFAQFLQAIVDEVRGGRSHEGVIQWHVDHTPGTDGQLHVLAAVRTEASADRRGMYIVGQFPPEHNHEH
jgi:hypothetical protein